jgi:hypothetical protein
VGREVKDGPKRWRDDPEVPEALRRDLSAEAESLASHDLGAMQQALQAKIAAGASAGVGAASVVPYLIGALVLGGAATWWAATGGPEPVQVASVDRSASAVRGDADSRTAVGSEGDIDEDRADGVTDERASGGANARGVADGVTDERGAHAAEERGANGAAGRGANATADQSGAGAAMARSGAHAAAEGGARGGIAKSDAYGVTEARAGHATKTDVDGAPTQGGANAGAAAGAHGASAKDGVHGAAAKDANGAAAKDTNGAAAKDANGAAAKDANGATAKDASGATAKDANGAAARDANGATAKDANGATAKDANGASAKGGANGASAKDANGATAQGGAGTTAQGDGAASSSGPGAAPASDLAAQLDAYERAQRLLGDGDAAAAIHAFAAYLAAYPDGRLRTEARLGQLHALFAAERFAQAAAAAESLRGGALAAHRRRDVERVLGESRAMLGACDAADAALKRAGTSGEERARIIARCRGASKE